MGEWAEDRETRWRMMPIQSLSVQSTACGLLAFVPLRTPRATTQRRVRGACCPSGNTMSEATSPSSSEGLRPSSRWTITPRPRAGAPSAERWTATSVECARPRGTVWRGTCQMVHPLITARDLFMPPRKRGKKNSTAATAPSKSVLLTRAVCLYKTRASSQSSAPNGTTSDANMNSENLPAARL